MATVTQTKTDKLLNQVLREVRALVEPIARAVRKPKNAKELPKWLQASLDDEKAGRISGPFSTVKELMASLNGSGK